MSSSCFWGHVKGNVLLLLPIHLQRTSISRKTCLSDNSWLTIIVTYNCWNGIIMCKLTRRISNKIGNLYRSFVLSSMQLLQLRMGLMYMQAGHNILRYRLSLCIWRPRTKLRCLRNYDTEHNQTKNSITRIMITSSNGHFFALLDLCDGNPMVTGVFPSQRSVTRRFEIFGFYPTLTFIELFL